MKLARPARRDHPEPIIALIDVVFFLLVFSLLVGRMDATAPFEVDPAISATGSVMPGGGETVSIAADGTLALNGAKADRAALLEDVGRAIAGDPEVLIRVNAHRDAEMRDVLPLIAAIEAAGAADIVLVVTPDSLK